MKKVFNPARTRPTVLPSPCPSHVWGARGGHASQGVGGTEPRAPAFTLTQALGSPQALSGAHGQCGSTDLTAGQQ